MWWEVCNGNWPQIFVLSLQRSARPQPPLLRQPNEIEGSDRIVIIFDKQHRGFHGIRKKARLPHPLRGGTRSHTRERRKIKAVQNNNPRYVVLPVTTPAHIVV